MFDFDRKHGLTFLFTLAAVPLAGCPSDDDGTTGASDSSSSGTDTNDPTVTTTNSTTNGTTLSTSADSSDTGVTEGSTESGSTDPSATGSTDTGSESGSDSSSAGTSSGDSSSDDGSSSESGVGPGDPLCAENADLFVECVPEQARMADEVEAQCNYELGYTASYSPECGAAFEEFLTCINMSDCEDILTDTACPDESDAFDVACGNDASETGMSESGDEPPPPDEG